MRCLNQVLLGVIYNFKKYHNKSSEDFASGLYFKFVIDIKLRDKQKA